MKAVAVLLVLLAAIVTANPFYENLDLDKYDDSLPDLSKLKTTHRQAVRCGRGCRFSFCNGNSNLFVGTPDVSASDSICKNRRNFFVGIVGETGEALVTTRGFSRVPISEYRPEGLTQSFSRSFFKTFRMPRAVTSGVGHQNLQGNQHKFIDDLCVRLPIRSYQRVNFRGNRVLNRISTTNPRDCIAFTTEVPRIIIELMWQSGDDLDLHVIEPDGDEVFFGNMQTEAGELLEDMTSFCGTPGLTGRERTVYVADGPIENGSYTIQAQHFNNCGDGSTKWRIRVFIDGKLTETRRGNSNQDNNEIIDNSVFSITVNF